MAKGINSFVFIDFETGGFDAKKNPITEIAAVAIKGDTLEKIDLLSTYIKPYGVYGKPVAPKEGEMWYEPEALKFTGITFQDLETGISLEEAVKELIDILTKSDLTPRNQGSKPIMVAHNSAFDKGFLIQMFMLTGKMDMLKKHTYGKEDYWGNYQPEMMDSIHFAKLAFGHDPDMPNFKLATCIEKSGLELADGHRAINDTIALKDLVVNLTSKMRREEGELTETTSEKKFREHWQF